MYLISVPMYIHIHIYPSATGRRWTTMDKTKEEKEKAKERKKKAAGP